VALDPTAEMAGTETLATECEHWWQIESPNGETSQGTCKHCGASRSFSNSSQTRMMARSVRPANNANKMSV
jgi:hypothetical protein